MQGEALLGVLGAKPPTVRFYQIFQSQVYTYRYFVAPFNQQGREAPLHYLPQANLIIRMPAAKKIPGLSRAHFEPRKGTEVQAAQYCKKDGDFNEWGHLATKGAGSRTDVATFYEELKSGKNDIELMEADFNGFNRFMKSVDRYRYAVAPVRKNDLKVALFVGRPGTGKTRLAYDLFPNIYATPIGKDLWLDGYNGQKEVLLDDFTNGMRLVDLLRFLDRYPILVPRKGGFVWWLPDYIIITTNVHPKNWYKYEERLDSAQALARRIHSVWDFDNKVQTDGPDKGDPTELSMEQYWVI